MRMRRRPWLAPTGACAFVALLYGSFLGTAPGSASGLEAHGMHGMNAVPAGITAHDHSASPTRKADPCARIAAPRRQRQCEASVLPPAHSLSAMGVPDFGGGSAAAVKTRNLDTFRGPAGVPDVSFTLTAATGMREVGGIPREVLTFNGTTPGPTLTVRQGDLVEVRLRNADVRRGVTIHWHGIDVPGREDGVAGVTQNAVLPGQEYVYRFIAVDAGTYWYHSHQDSLNQVGKGLVGALVIEPPEGPPPGTEDVVTVAHTYGPSLTLNGEPGEALTTLPSGSMVRVRLVNTDSGPAYLAASSPFRVAAIDGFDLSDPTDLADTFVEVPAGGRVDLLATVPDGNLRVGLINGPSLILGPDPAAGAPPVAAVTRFDPLTYGRPGGAQSASTAFGRVTRDFAYRVGQRFGYLDGRYGNWFTINGKLIPDVPMFMVRPGDVVRFRIVNTTTTVHPMHLHGHHALVLSRNGQPSTGSAWWVDSLEVQPGESYDIEFVADNPGVWMFHCHNLPHARAGLVTHLMYENVESDYRIGRVAPRLVNQPE